MNCVEPITRIPETAMAEENSKVKWRLWRPWHSELSAILIMAHGRKSTPRKLFQADDIFSIFSSPVAKRPIILHKMFRLFIILLVQLGGWEERKPAVYPYGSFLNTFL